jgi:hypothetical protein
VHRQLTLWAEPDKPTQQLTIWEDIHPVARTTFVAAISRLIAKAVRSEKLTKMGDSQPPPVDTQSPTIQGALEMAPKDPSTMEAHNARS